MSIELIDAGMVPATAFVRRSRLTECNDWRETIAALSGIKPGKAIRVVLGHETIQLSKNAGALFKRRLTEHIKQSKMKLDVSLRKGSDGSPAIYVSNLGSK